MLGFTPLAVIVTCCYPVRPTWSETLNMNSAKELTAKFGNFSSGLTGSLSGWTGSYIGSNYTWRTLIPDTTAGAQRRLPTYVTTQSHRYHLDGISAAWRSHNATRRSFYPDSTQYSIIYTCILKCFEGNMWVLPGKMSTATFFPWNMSQDVGSSKRRVYNVQDFNARHQDATKSLS